MSTRGLVGFVIDGKVKAAYNHYDSYPGGLGDDVLNFLLRIISEDKLAKAKSLASALIPVDPSTSPTEKQKVELKPFADIRVGTQSLDDWYCLLRNSQGDIDVMLLAGYYIDRADFALDSLWCEWAYLVNFDDNTLEVYKGFQKEYNSSINTGRFASPDSNEQGYFPVALVDTLPFDNLPDRLNGASYSPDDEN